MFCLTAALCLFCCGCSRNLLKCRPLMLPFITNIILFCHLLQLQRDWPTSFSAWFDAVASVASRVFAGTFNVIPYSLFCHSLQHILASLFWCFVRRRRKCGKPCLCWCYRCDHNTNIITFVTHFIQTGQPILVLGSTPSQVSQAVAALASLVAPISYGGDIRPYLTICT